MREADPCPWTPGMQGTPKSSPCKSDPLPKPFVINSHLREERSRANH